MFLLLVLAVLAAFNGPIKPTEADAATYSATQTIPVPPASSYAGSGGGDGWAVALSSTSVYNVFHHSGNLEIACHLQSTAEPCWDPKTITDADGNDFATSGQPGLRLEPGTNNLFVFAARASDGVGGVVCISTSAADVGSDPFCGFTALTAPGDASAAGLSSPGLVGGRWYSFNYVPGSGSAGGQNTLLCFDFSTHAACASQPFRLPDAGNTEAGAAYPNPGIAALGEKIIIPRTRDTGDELSCFDSATMRACSGSWPIALSSSYVSSQAAGGPFPRLDARGNVVGFCLPTGDDPCFDLQGASASTPPGLTDAVGATSPWNGPSLALGTRIYVPNGNSNAVGCYDFQSESGCSGFPKTFPDLSLLYTVNPDPARPACLWVNSDGGTGQIQNLDAYSGTACGQGPIRVLASSFVVPLDRCVPASYVSLAVTAPTRNTYALGTVTFANSNGDPLLGNLARSIDVSGAVALSGLSLPPNSPLPQFLITLLGSQGTPGAVSVRLTWTGTADPACSTGGVRTVVVPPQPKPKPKPPVNPVKTLRGFLSKHWKAIGIGYNASVVVFASGFCGGSIFTDFASFGLTAAASVAMCDVDVGAIVGLASAIADPPDRHFATVFRARPLLRLPHLRRCRKLSRATCAAGQKALMKYERATSQAQQLAVGLGVTANRFGGAVQAGDASGISRQRVAGAALLKRFTRAESALRSAAKSLALFVKRHHLNSEVSLQRARRSTKALLGLRHVSHTVISRLVSTGLTNGRANLAKQIKVAVARAGVPQKTSVAGLLTR